MHGGKDASLDFSLKKIDETRNKREVKHNQLISKKHKKDFYNL